MKPSWRTTTPASNRSTVNGRDVIKKSCASRKQNYLCITHLTLAMSINWKAENASPITDATTIRVDASDSADWG